MPPRSAPPSPATGPAGATQARPGLVRRVANLAALADLPGLLGRLQASGVPAARLDAGPYPLAYLARPATVRAVLDGRIEGVAERGRFFEDVSRVIGAHSLVTCAGDEHRRLRRLLSAAFRPEQVASAAATMADAAQELSDVLADGQERELGDMMGELTLEIAARALLGLERGDQLADVRAVLVTGMRLFYRLLLPRRLGDAVWRSRISPANRRLAAAQAGVDRFVEALLAERRAGAAVGAGQPEAARRAGRPPNLLDVLLASHGGGALDDVAVRDQIVTFLFAGHETTAQALTWAFVLLDRHPEVRRRLEAELDALGRPPAVKDLVALPLTRAVVRETLRLYPPAWFLARETVAPVVLDGCPMPKGTLLLASSFVLQRDPAAFPDPERFDPDRWLAAAGELAPPDAYLPFGHGRHNCIGSTFALSELALVVATLSRSWRLRLVDPDRVVPWPTVTLRPRHAVHVVVERRSGAER